MHTIADEENNYGKLKSQKGICAPTARWGDIWHCRNDYERRYSTLSKIDDKPMGINEIMGFGT